MVVPESQLAKAGPASVAAGKQVMLALDAVFGQSGQQLAAMLAPGATFANYGSLGGAGGQLILTQELIFWKQVTFKNFQLSQALSRYIEEAQFDLLSWFTDLFEARKLASPPVNRVEWEKEGIVQISRRRSNQCWLK
jgi:trans-2-enoyl-CoA reductase